jgi:hypothetical protein
MISGERGPLIPFQVNPNVPVLAACPDYRNMLVLSSRAFVPGPFPSSFTTGTTLPPPADPFQLTGDTTLQEEARLFNAFEMDNRDGKSLASERRGSPSPLQTAFRGEHVVLLL